MRDEIIINSTVKRIGNSFAIPISRYEVDLLGVDPNDDIEVHIIVKQRIGGSEKSSENRPRRPKRVFAAGGEE